MDTTLLNLIVNKLSRIEDELKQLNITAVRHDDQLAIHLRRSELVEEQFKLMQQKMELELAPVKNHVAFVNFGLKLFGGIASLGTVTVVILNIIKLLKNG